MKEKKTSLDKLMSIINYVGSVILMSLLFLVCCLPIVTMGQAWSAVLFSVRYMIRKDDWWEGFKYGLKTRFWRGIAAWCIMLLPNIYFLLELHHGYAQVFVEGNMDNLVQFISACVMLAMTTMLTNSLLLLNVYVPTKVSLWVRNSTSVVFKAPVQLLLATALLWLPILLALLWPVILFYTVLLFLVAYFPLTGLISTVVMRNTLWSFFVEAQAGDELLAQESKMASESE